MQERERNALREALQCKCNETCGRRDCNVKWKRREKMMSSQSPSVTLTRALFPSRFRFSLFPPACSRRASARRWGRPAPQRPRPPPPFPHQRVGSPPSAASFAAPNPGSRAKSSSRPGQGWAGDVMGPRWPMGAPQLPTRELAKRERDGTRAAGARVPCASDNEVLVLSSHHHRKAEVQCPDQVSLTMFE